MGPAPRRSLLPRPRSDLLESGAMARVNDHYLKLRASYLFSETGRRVREFQAAHPDAKLIRLGIGDVTQPLPAAVIRAMHEAEDEMARAETFRGYPPETGLDFHLVHRLFHHTDKRRFEEHASQLQLRPHIA